MHRNPDTSAVSIVWRQKPAAEKILGLVLAAAFLVHLGGEIIETARQMLASPQWRHALSLSAVAGLATGVGALAVFFLPIQTGRSLAITMAIAAGAMSTAALLSLLVPAWNLGQAGIGALALAIFAGAALMFALDRATPHQHAPASGPGGRDMVRASWLLVAAISLHNLPEGLAVGVSVGTGTSAATALAIGFQNLPEGLVIAALLAGAGTSRLAAVTIATASGLVEPLGAFVGIAGIGAVPAAAPLAMAGAAGAMLFVVGHELIPAARRTLADYRSGAAFAGGFVTMAVANGIL